MASFHLPRPSGSPACAGRQPASQPCGSHGHPVACHWASGVPSACAPTGVAVAPVAPVPIPAADPVTVTAADRAAANSFQSESAPAATTPASQEPAPGSPAALELLASMGIAPRAGAGRPLGPDDVQFSSLNLNHCTHRLVEVKLLLDQLTAEQKQLHELLRLAHLRGDLLHLVPPGQEPGTYQLPDGPTLHRRQGHRQWHYSPAASELEAQLKARQVYEQAAGLATSSIGASFWELRFPKG